MGRCLQSELPHADGSFDAVLALECAFAFPSRARFFQQARRVLRPGGTLALCDFVLARGFAALWKQVEERMQPAIARSYGQLPARFCSLADYCELARQAGFELHHTEDITRNTLPTYSAINPLLRRNGDSTTYRASRGLAAITRLRLLRYAILSWQWAGPEKPV